MFITRKKIILASGSPRRKQFLADLGLDFRCQPAKIDETPLKNEMPADFAMRMARDKAGVVADLQPDAWVIGSDTVVTLGTEILGKPDNEEDALTMLRSLQGKTHQVITGLSLVCLQEKFSHSLTRTTQVSFARFPDTILSAYIKTGDPMDKAGSYGIQGQGAFLVKEINGSCANVIGLPVQICTALLLAEKVISPRP